MMSVPRRGWSWRQRRQGGGSSCCAGGGLVDRWTHIAAVDTQGSCGRSQQPPCFDWPPVSRRQCSRVALATAAESSTGAAASAGRLVDVGKSHHSLRPCQCTASSRAFPGLKCSDDDAAWWWWWRERGSGCYREGGRAARPGRRHMRADALTHPRHCSDAPDGGCRVAGRGSTTLHGRGLSSPTVLDAPRMTAALAVERVGAAVMAGGGGRRWTAATLHSHQCPTYQQLQLQKLRGEGQPPPPLPSPQEQPHPPLPSPRGGPVLLSALPHRLSFYLSKISPPLTLPSPTIPHLIAFLLHLTHPPSPLTSHLPLWTTLPPTASPPLPPTSPAPPPPFPPPVPPPCPCPPPP